MFVASVIYNVIEHVLICI